MSYASDLENILDNFAEASEEFVLDEARELGRKAFIKIIRRTPVDSGRARGGWTLGLGTAQRSPSNRIAPGGSETLGEELPILKKLKLGQAIIINNDLPYIAKLENGSSTQAPNGMVALTIRELLSE